MHVYSRLFTSIHVYSCTRELTFVVLGTTRCFPVQMDLRLVEVALSCANGVFVALTALDAGE